MQIKIRLKMKIHAGPIDPEELNELVDSNHIIELDVNGLSEHLSS